MNELAYVYKITNKQNNKVYIGITRDRDVFSRWHEHFSSNSKVGKDIELYGIDSFIFEVLEKVENISNKDLFRLETRYIQKCNSINYGYNVRNSAPVSVKTAEYSEVSLEGMRYFAKQVYLGNPIKNSNNKLSFWNLLKDKNLCILTILSNKNYLTNKNSKYHIPLLSIFTGRAQRFFKLESMGTEYVIEDVFQVLDLMSTIYEENRYLSYSLLSYTVNPDFFELTIKDKDIAGPIKVKIYSTMLYEDETPYYMPISKIQDMYLS